VPKARQPIAEAEVPRTFDDTCIERLATIARLPDGGAHTKRFAQGVREAARIYARDARVSTNNELHMEVAALYRAAERKGHEQTAALLEKLSSRARDLLNKRAARPSLGLELPAPRL
jgi:hypothetical protein